jgi:hypothetical protein
LILSAHRVADFEVYSFPRVSGPSDTDTAVIAANPTTYHETRRGEPPPAASSAVAIMGAIPPEMGEVTSRASAKPVYRTGAGNISANHGLCAEVINVLATADTIKSAP